MEKFISNTKNPYKMQSNFTKQEELTGKFIPKCKVGKVPFFGSNASAIQGGKVTFKHV